MKLKEYLIAIAEARSAGEVRELLALGESDADLSDRAKLKVEAAAHKKSSRIVLPTKGRASRIANRTH